MQLAPYTPQQELANVLTHAFGLLLSIVGVPFLVAIAVQHQLGVPQLASIGLYALSLLLVYSCSTAYHAVTDLALKWKLKLLDHICIYLLIAGSITALLPRYVAPGQSTVFLIAIWCAVIGGIVFKIFFVGRFKLASTIIYLLLGGSAFIMVKPLYAQMPAEGFYALMGGAASYGLGTIFYLNKRIYYQHAIWHVFVLGGSVGHYIALLYSI